MSQLGATFSLPLSRLPADAFRTLQLVLDEYVNYVIEMLQSNTIEQQYNDVLKVHGSE